MPSTFVSRRPRRSRAHWSRLIAEQAASDLSPRTFCAERNLGLRQFLRWKHKLNGAGESPAAPAFLELPGPGAAPAPSASGFELELELGEGMRLRFRRR
jgi:hypothetical protein